MGATNFIEQQKGISAREAYNELVDEATFEYGNDSYNGTISTCSLGRQTLRFDMYHKSNEKKALEHINKLGYGNKWQADYVDLGVVRYDVVTYKTVNTKGKPPVVRVRYVVKNESGTQVKFFETKKEADVYALQLSMKHNRVFSTHKEGVVIEGDNRLSTVVTTLKSYKTKPNLKPMPNRKIIEIRKYMFYGWAAC